MACQACGAASQPAQRFCGECGASIVPGCPSCGATNPVGQRFCGDCGQALVPAPIPAGEGIAPATSPVAERRVCSVLFCDLVGFTPLSEARDPEEVRELLSRYFETARTVIGRYGGVVEKFIGDAVMAVWGAPVATEGDTERAVRAALDLVDAVAALGVEVGAPTLAARAGVVTGEVAVTIGAANQGMVAGDAVNTAARVQSAATPRTVLVDDATRRLAQAGVGFDDAGQHELKGKAEPQRLWRAVRVLSGVGGAQRVDGLEAPLTGRDPELRTIKELFHATVDRKQPRMVVVSGPAGVGKSRLGWEFEKYIDGLADVVRWHRGRCLSYGDGVAFWALSQIVRQRLGIAEEDQSSDAISKLAAGVAKYVADPADRDYIGTRLGRLLGLVYPGDGGQELARDELFAGWRLYIERIAATSPVILLIEDAQFADAGLRDFLDHLVDWARDVPIFVLLFSRPELEASRASWSSGRNRSMLGLDPLDATSMAALLEALVPGMPTEAAASIAEHAHGIPLFAVETIRSLIDRDVVVPAEGSYRLVGDIGTLTVPDSLHGLLAARLDALDPVVRSLVADAAVLGTTFPTEALIAVSTRSDHEVRAGLDELIRREVLEVSADPLSPQIGTYRFAHEMLRQVAYETLSRRDRKSHHLAVAAHLRTTFAGDGEEVVDVIARHYLDALTAVPDDPDAAEIGELAVTALTRAAQRAERTGAPTQAGTSYAAAADLTRQLNGPDAPLAARFWERAAAASVISADWSLAIERADHAGAGYRALGDLRGAARAKMRTGQALRLAGRQTEAREQLTAALDVLGNDPDTDTVRALMELATIETFAASPDADRLTTDALTLGQALVVDDDMLANLFTMRGIWFAFARRRPQAGAYYREAARLAERSGSSDAAGRALMNLSDILTMDDPAGGVDAARAALVHLRRTGDKDLLGYAIGNLAAALLSLGEWDTARETVDRAMEQDGLHDSEFVRSCRAFIAGLCGDGELAARLLADLPSLRATEYPQERSYVALADGVAANAAGDTVAALRYAQQALTDVESLGLGAESTRWAWGLAARCAYELGDDDAQRSLLALLDNHPNGLIPPTLIAERALVRARLTGAASGASSPAGDSGESANVDLAAAVVELRAMSTPFQVAHGLLDQADHLVAIGRADEAAVLTDEATEIGRRLGCLPLLARAEARRTASLI